MSVDKPPIKTSARAIKPAPPLASQRLSDQLAARLLAQLDSGELRAGDKLPTEADLAAVHGVSRSVVREAVHQLRSRGLVLSRQGSGMFVAVRTEQQPLAFDPLVLQSIDSVLQVVEVRRALEGEMAALAAQRATRTQITAMRRALKAIDTAMHSGADGVAEDLAFHRSMASATGNPQFTRLLSFLEQYLLDAMRVTKGNEARSAEFMAQVNAEHHALLDAIAARDEAAARAAAVAHLLRGERRLHEGGLIAAPVRHVKRVVRKAAPARSAK